MHARRRDGGRTLGIRASRQGRQVRCGRFGPRRCRGGTRLRFTVGGNNVFNVKPTRQNDLETDNGFIYDSVQFGLNGASYFARAHYKF